MTAGRRARYDLCRLARPRLHLHGSHRARADARGAAGGVHPSLQHLLRLSELWRRHREAVQGGELLRPYDDDLRLLHGQLRPAARLDGGEQTDS